MPAFTNKLKPGLYASLSRRERLSVTSVFAASLFMVAIALVYFITGVGKPYLGINFSLTAQGWIADSVDTDGVASQMGVKQGDKLIEINGRPADILLDKYRSSGTVIFSSFQQLVFIDGTGQNKYVNMETGSLSWQALMQQLALAAISLILWFVGFYVYLKRPENIAAMLLCIFGGLVGLSLSGSIGAAVGIPSASELHVAASIIAPWLLVRFMLVLPEENDRLRRNLLTYVIYLLPVVTLILLPIVGWSGGQPVQWFRTFRLLGYALGFLVATGVAVFNYYHSHSAKTKQQMRIVLLSVLAALTPVLILNVIPFAISRDVIIPPGLSILFIGFIPIGLGYAVVTQKLLDIDVIVRRGLIYGTITLVMTALLSVVVFSVLEFHQSLGVGEQILAALSAGGLATILFGPTKQWTETLVDRLFYKDRYDYRQIINALSDSLKLMKDTTEISRVLVGTAAHTLNVAGGCLFVKGVSGFEVGASQGIFAGAGKRGQLLSLLSQRSDRIEFPNSAAGIGSNVEFLIPLVAGGKEVGILYLSPKVSKQNYSSDDIYLLQGLASVGAIALRGALLVRDVSLRDTFVSIASHELRTPLTSIVGYADLLLRRDLPDATRKQWLQIILDNGEKIAAMLDDLLDISRIRSGRVSLKLERLQLPGILSEELATIRESTDKHEFIVDIAPDLHDVLADHDKFGQIMGNLLSNAVKYSPHGGRITLSARNDPGQRRVVVSVADEGIGISHADKEYLFRTFHRIQRPETQGIRGIGLGLYIVKEWTEAMGGMVWFDSELNKGSTFFVAMPIWQPDRAV
ncbi:MAG: ATP-binding protein [Dehalococcoidales bacterium]|nr:ATP-binding protein [Dehalococcoidales bacterium]